MELSGLFGTILPFLTDRMKVSRMQLSENEDGSSGYPEQPTVISEDVPCLSQVSQNDDPSIGQILNNSNVSLKIFCGLDVDVQNGDIVEVSKISNFGDTIKTHVGQVGQPAFYPFYKTFILFSRSDV